MSNLYQRIFRKRRELFRVMPLLKNFPNCSKSPKLSTQPLSFQYIFLNFICQNFRLPNSSQNNCRMNNFEICCCLGVGIAVLVILFLIKRHENQTFKKYMERKESRKETQKTIDESIADLCSEADESQRILRKWRSFN